jgi:hypothetical protein
MQLLAAIAVIILLFIAYSYMNKDNRQGGENSQYHPRTSTDFKNNVSAVKKDSPKGRKKGKILNFNEYKNKFSNTNNKE